MPGQFVPIDHRLARRLARQDARGCIEWTGAVNTKGYGRLKMSVAGSTYMMAHRLAYEIAKGAIPAGLQIDHLCRNRRCCNPDHLEAVTARENIARGNAPNALNARKTHCVRGHEFTPENTRLYLSSKRQAPARQCRECRRAYIRARREEP